MRCSVAASSSAARRSSTLLQRCSCVDQHMFADRRKRLERCGARVPARLAGAMMAEEAGAVVDQPERTMPLEQVGVARRAVDVEHERIEPDDLGGELCGGRIEWVVRQRAGQEVEADVEAGRGAEQVLDLGIGLGDGDPRVELDEHELGHVQTECTRQLAGDQLGSQRARSLAGAAELDDVEPVVVCLDEPGQRAALAQCGHIAGGDDRAHLARETMRRLCARARARARSDRGRRGPPRRTTCSARLTPASTRGSASCSRRRRRVTSSNAAWPEPVPADWCGVRIGP